MTTAIYAIIIFGMLVVSHEFGHFIAAKKSGVTVEEFSIGMGPKVAGWISGTTRYSIRIFPVGGYVRMLGEEEKVEGTGSYQEQPLKNRIAIILSGPVMNILLAILIFSLIFFIIGKPTTIIGSVEQGYPAQQAGIMPGDRVVAIDGMKIEAWEDIQRSIYSFDGDQLKIEVERNGQALSFYMTPVKDDRTGNRLIGISPSYKKDPINALYLGATRSIEMISLMVSYIGNLITGNATADELVGAVGMIHLVSEAAKTGFLNILFLAGLLSLNLGVINLLPVPAIDGGKLIFLLVEAVRGKPIDIEKEGFIHLIGFILLIMLMLVVTYKDIIRFDLF
jgi:regulator of sigma E protease